MLDPALAQHTRAVRTRGFFSSKDIATVRAAAAAAATTPSAAAAAEVAAEEDCEAPVYLQHGGLSASLVPLVDRIFAHACRVDAEQGWGMVTSGDVRAAGNVHARCVEFHEYGAGRRRRCGCRRCRYKLTCGRDGHGRGPVDAQFLVGLMCHVVEHQCE